MKIGVDVSAWFNPRGQGRFAREIIRALIRLDSSIQYSFFLDEETANLSHDLPAAENTKQVIVSTAHAASRGASTSCHRTFHDLWAMVKAARRHRDQIDIFYFPSATTFFPLWRGAKIILTIHDAIPSKYPDLIFTRRRNQWLWNLKLRWAIKEADSIATVTETAKRDIRQAFRVAEEKIAVVPGGVGPPFCRHVDPSNSRSVVVEYGIQPHDQYFLYVGGLSPHKNVEILLEALAELRRTRDNDALKLILTGDYRSFPSHYLALRTKAANLGLADKVIFTGPVSDPHLVHLYNAAFAFVTASLDEGFGLPPLEAMACGTPVIASRIGAITEVVGTAGLFFNPYEKIELATHLQGLLSNSHLREDMSQKGLLRSQAFSWDNSAKIALNLFERVWRQPSP